MINQFSKQNLLLWVINLMLSPENVRSVNHNEVETGFVFCKSNSAHLMQPLNCLSTELKFKTST